MELIADFLLLAATVGAAVYCYVLAARLRRFTTLETGMGGAIAVLSAQVDDMTRALQKAQGVASGSEQRLEELTARADLLSRRLELLVASLHDLPETAAPGGAPPRESHGREGPVREGPVREGPVREGPVREGPGRESQAPPATPDEEEPRRLRFVRRRAGARDLPEDEE
jgi:hypothetical protein